MRSWIIKEGFATEEFLVQIEEDAKKKVRIARKSAWESYITPILKEKENLLSYLEVLRKVTHNDAQLQVIFSELENALDLGYKDIISAGRQIKQVLSNYSNSDTSKFNEWP